MLNCPVASMLLVLKLSKLHMYWYYYDVVKRKYPGSKSVLAYTDTDNFFMKIATKDLYPY